METGHILWIVRAEAETTGDHLQNSTETYVLSEGYLKKICNDPTALI
jgi:hypothetical protein